MNDLIAALSSSEAVPGALVLAPLVAPFRSAGLSLWLLEWLMEAQLRPQCAALAPEFTENAQDGSDPAALVAAFAQVREASILFGAKARALAEVLELDIAKAGDWNPEETIVTLLVPPRSLELSKLIAEFTRAFFSAHEDGDDVTVFCEAASALNVLSVPDLVSESSEATVLSALAGRLDAMRGEWEEPQLTELLQWLETDVNHWLFKLFRVKRPALERRLHTQIVSQFIALRTEELFDLVVGYPEETTVAVTDLRAALVALAPAEAAHELQTLAQRLGEVMQKRLLHPGVNTGAIISTYQLAIHVLRAVDPSGVTLDRVAAPIRSYLAQRTDTIRCIVQSLTDPNGDLYAELCKPLEEVSAAESLEAWEPEPADGLPQSDGVSRNKDVVAMLVNVFGGADPFVQEFKALLSQRLLGITDYNVDADIRILELLKLRFGESALLECEVMLRDMAKSKRVNKHIVSGSGELLEDFSATIVSYLFWPPQSSSASATALQGMQLGAEIAEQFEAYSKAFSEHKASRKLEWNLSQGSATVEVELPSGRVLTFEGVSILQTSVLELFQSQASWSLDELTDALLMDTAKETVRRALLFWIGSGIIRPDGQDQWTLQTQDQGEAHVANAEDMMQESDDDDEEDWSMAEPFVLHMLNNLGPLGLSQIHDQLKNFADISRPVAELKDFLEELVREEKICKKDGRYAPV